MFSALKLVVLLIVYAALWFGWAWLFVKVWSHTYG